MTTPFVAFETTQHARPTTEILLFGAAIGALAGGVFPALALAAELIGGTGLLDLLSSPSASFAVTLLVPVAGAGLGGWWFAYLRAQHQAYDEVAAKAGSLLDESWELRESLATLDQAWTSDPQPDLDRIPTEEIVQSNVEPLLHAQTLLLHSVGSAARDASQRMRVNLRSLELTPMSQVQTRLVAALDGHLQQLRDLADDVVEYADEGQSTTNASHGAPRPQTAA